MYKNLIKNVFIFLIVLAILVLIVSKDLFSSIKISLIYCLFFYAPSLILVNNIKSFGPLERFALANLIGLSYGSIYFVLDVLFKVPLNNLTFIIVTIIFYILAIYLNKKTGTNKDENSSNI